MAELKLGGKTRFENNYNKSNYNKILDRDWFSARLFVT